MTTSKPETKRPIRVLCVDDHTDILTLLKMTIANEADMRHVGSVASADALMPELSSANPDVVLLDNTMPSLDPISVLRQARDQHPDARFIVFSGYDDTETIDRALEAGAWGFVSKHLGMPALLNAIRSVAAGKVTTLR